MLKKIDGFPDYSITDQGSVVNTRTGRFLSLTPNTSGYLQCHIVSDDGESKQVRVHRLVAAAFLTRSDLATEVNHIDGNKQNNRVSNLEWVTRSQNVQHAFDTGLKHVLGLHGCKNVNAKLNPEKIQQIRSLKGLKTQRLIAEEFGVSQTTVSAILRRQAWKHTPATKKGQE